MKVQEHACLGRLLVYCQCEHDFVPDTSLIYRGKIRLKAGNTKTIDECFQ